MTPRPQGYRAPTDEEALHGQPIPAGAIRLTQEHGWVPLRGNTTWDAVWIASYFAFPDADKVAVGNTSYAFGRIMLRATATSDIMGQAAESLRQPVTLPDPKQVHGEKKPQLHLIPLAAQEEMAKALELGATKYGERNWLLGNGVNITTYLSAMARHLALVTDGKEDIDPESGAHHLGHVMAGCGIVLDALRHEKLIDNRVKPESNGTRIARENRALCNNLTSEERATLHAEAMQMIGNPPQEP